MNELNFRHEGAVSRPLPTGSVDDAPLGRAGAARIAPLVTQYLNIARRRKWLILGAIAVALALGLGLTLMMTPQYTAKATLNSARELQHRSCPGRGARNQHRRPGILSDPIWHIGIRCLGAAGRDEPESLR